MRESERREQNVIGVRQFETYTRRENGRSGSGNSGSDSSSTASVVGVVAAIVLIRHFPHWPGGNERPQDTLTLVISNNNGEEMINTLQPSP